MNNSYQSVLSKKSIVVLLLIFFTILIIVSGFFYYKYEEKNIITDKSSELEAIASLKINQVLQWKHERTADAYVMSHSSYFVKAVDHLFHDSMNLSFINELQERLNLAKDQYNYENIILFDTKKKIVLAAIPDTTSLYSFTSEEISKAIETKQIVYSDFYYCNLHKKIHYDIFAPLIGENNHVIAVLVFRLNPSDNLYRVIQNWPTKSKTSETLLLRKEGNEVLFLNELRHKKNTVLKFKLPMTHNETPAVQAAKGYTGIFKGSDYRGVDVLSYVCSVPGTPWFMVAKVDKEEILIDLYYKAALITIISILLILLVWIGLGFIYRSRQSKTFRELWQTQKEARTTLYSIGDGVLITDEKGKIKQLNPIAEKLTGWKEEDALGKPVNEVFVIINEITRKITENPVQRVIQEGIIAELENHTLLISRNGNEIPIADSAAPIKNANGIITGIVLVFRDQSRERARQKVIEENEATLRGILDAVKESIWLFDVKGNIILGNETAFGRLGRTKDQIIGKNFNEFISPNVAAYRQEKLEQVFHTGQPVQFEDFRNDIYFSHSFFPVLDSKGCVNYVAAFSSDITERKRKEQEVHNIARFVDENPSPVLRISQTGSILYANQSWFNAISKNPGIHNNEIPVDWKNIITEVLARNETLDIETNIGESTFLLLFVPVQKENYINVYGRNITERIMMENALRESEAKLKDAQAIAHIGSFTFDIDKWTVEWSEELFRIFGRNIEEGNPVLEEMFAFIHPDDLSRVRKVFNDSIEDKINMDEEFRIIRNGGETRYVNTLGYPVESDNSKVNKLFGAILDITERKKTELKLEETLNELQRSNRDLEQFAYIASHDLHEPLRMIKNYTDLIMRRFSGSFDNELKDYFGFISDGATRMHQLINALLQYSRISSSKKEFGLVDCNEVVIDVLKDLKLMIEDSKAVITTGNLPKVNGNKIMLRLLFQNLIQNAIKFRDVRIPEIVISCEKKENWWLIKIKDNGIGIAQEYHDKIFLIFQRLHTKDKYPGTGIGLAACKKIIEHHGGQICLESIVGQGTTFYFTLPGK